MSDINHTRKVRYCTEVLRISAINKMLRLDDDQIADITEKVVTAGERFDARHAIASMLRACAAEIEHDLAPDQDTRAYKIVTQLRERAVNVIEGRYLR